MKIKYLSQFPTFEHYSKGKDAFELSAGVSLRHANGCCSLLLVVHSIMQKVGVNVEELLLSQPDSGEQGLDTMDELARSGVVNLVVIDSVSALIPRAELDGEIGQSQVGIIGSVSALIYARKIGGAANHGRPPHNKHTHSWSALVNGSPDTTLAEVAVLPITAGCHIASTQSHTQLECTSQWQIIFKKWKELIPWCLLEPLPRHAKQFQGPRGPAD